MAVTEEFLEGNRRRYTVTFTVAGAVTDPTTVKFYRRRMGSDPGTLETYTFGVDLAVVKESTGVYHVELDYPTDGRFVVGSEGTGACVAYEEVNVVVGNAKARA